MTGDESPTTEDLWSWATADEEEPELHQADPAGVTAVMVVRDAKDWLPRQLLALAALEPRPGRIVAVDNGSADDSPALLERARSEGVLDDVIEGGPDLGFGQAVALGLGDDEPEWVWLLHDDSSPRRDALGELLRGAAVTGAAVLFPKLLQPKRRNYPEVLSEVGHSITRSGRRVSTVEEGDVDQKQTHARPVLGGSTAGMLVRGDVWRELGGLAEEIPFHRDGVDLGWRAWDAGHQVTTWPDAALTHRRSGRTGERGPNTGYHEDDRLAAMRLVAARGAKPASRARLVAGSWLRAGGYLLAKSPGLARAELRAASRFRKDPAAIAALRARSTPDADAVVSVLPSRHWGLRQSLDRAGARVTERFRDLTTAETGTDIDELTGDDFAGGGRHARRGVPPLLLLFLVLAAAGLVAGRRLLISGGNVAGGGMLPAPADAASAWAAFLDPLVGIGGANAPWLGFSAFLSSLFFGAPGWFAVAALVFVPLLAGLSAYLLMRSFGARRHVAAVAGGLWAASVVLLGIVTAGDISGMVLAIAGPLAARSTIRLLTGAATGAERLRAPAGVAFWLIVATTAWPLVLVIATLIGILWLAGNRTTWLQTIIALGIPWLFMVGWLPSLIRHPGRILTGADPLAWPAFPPAGIANLAGRIFPSGLPLVVNIVFFGILGLAALIGLVRIRTPQLRWITMLGIGLPMLAGVVLSRLSLVVNGGQARALLSGWALLVVAALLVPILVPQLRVEDGARRPRRLVWAMVVLALTALMALATWAVVGFRGPVQPSPSQLPGYVNDVVNSPRDTRVLMIERLDDEHLAWNVVDSRQPTWGTGERNPAGSFATEFAGLVQAFSGGDAPEDLAERLTSLAVSHVWMKGFDEDRMAAIGNAAGLVSAAAGDDSVVWTVLGTPSLAQLVDGQGAIQLPDGMVPSGTGARWLQLSEEPDPRWWATVDHRELEPATDRPPVTFVLPDDASGPVAYGMTPAWGSFVWQLVLLAGVVLLAAPTLSGSTRARRGQQ